LKSASDRYYDLAKAANFDYTKLWNDNPRDVSKALTDANGFATRRAELAALAEGYFNSLALAYAEQRGQAALAERVKTRRVTASVQAVASEA